ncbi:MAG: hypothetical protein Ct9H300mP7_4930 [Verrucomicrobiota bacterium]|nr:MAG: hypothetical protein Ct9H300mP7_4930 [Verrucomicrobiota bacterium]
MGLDSSMRRRSIMTPRSDTLFLVFVCCAGPIGFDAEGVVDEPFVARAGNGVIYHPGAKSPEIRSPRLEQREKGDI